MERSYFPLGGTNAIHYFAATPMTNPTVAVPAQFPSTRKLQHGDVLVTEISAQFWEYSGQVLRSFAVDVEPSPLFRELHAVADAAFDAIVACIKPGVWADDLRNASLLIEEAGFTVIDDVVHGYGGGYLPPVLRAPSGIRSFRRCVLRQGWLSWCSRTLPQKTRVPGCRLVTSGSSLRAGSNRSSNSRGDFTS